MRQALIVVDYQKDFVDGSLGFPQAAQLEEGICQRICQYREQGGEVLFTFDTHGPDYLSTVEGRNLPVEHCRRGTPGWELYGRVAGLQQPQDRVFEKGTFGSLELAEYLREQGYSQVELAGVVTDICVLSNAVLAKAALPEARIVVDAALTASNVEENKQRALAAMRGLHIEVL